MLFDLQIFSVVFIPRAQPHAQSLCLFPIVFGINVCMYMNADLTWRRLIFGMSDNELKFTLQAITNTAPTPDNLRRWNCAQIDSSCTL